MFEIFKQISKGINLLYAFITFLIGAILDPTGFITSVCCKLIHFIFQFFPSTPDNLKIAHLLGQAGEAFPLVGSGILSEVFTTISILAGFVLAIKIYKLIPFKFS